MTVVRLNNLAPGMVPAGDVKDHRGRVLLVSGVEITEKHIKSFKAWGVTEVAIQDLPHQENNSETQKHMELPDPNKPEAEKLFQYTDCQHPAIQELFKLYLQRKTEMLNLKGANNGA